MRCNVLRCQGRFQEAYEILGNFMPRDSRMESQFGRVLCELGRCDEAIQELSTILARSWSPNIRIKLALANAYLVKCMQASLKGQRDWRTLQKSREAYKDLRTYTFPVTYFGKVDRLSVLIGLAIIEHLDGNVDSALRAWQVVSAASQDFLLTGYTDIIFAYSTGELQMRRGDTAQSDLLQNYARTLFSRTGRQHHFVGLGSYWPDILDSWYVARGRQPLSLA